MQRRFKCRFKYKLSLLKLVPAIEMSDCDSDFDSDLNSQELDSRATEAQPINTRKSTTWAVNHNVYKRWAARRHNYELIKGDLLEYREDLEGFSYFTVRLTRLKRRASHPVHSRRVIFCLSKRQLARNADFLLNAR